MAATQKSSKSKTANLNPSRVWLKRLLLVLFGLFISLVFLELATRMLHIGSGGFWEPNNLFGWRNIPNAHGWESCYGECEVYVEINSKGLRDYEYPYEKAPEVSRILFLGDSMTAGLQTPLENTFVKVLEKNIQQTYGENWEVINAAVNAFGTDNELIFYREEAVNYSPDIVVLSVYLANDVYNNHYQLETRLGGTGHKPYFTLDDNSELVLNNYPVENAETLGSRVFSFLNRNFQLPRFVAQNLNLRRNIPDFLRPLVELATGNRGAEKAASGQTQTGDQNGGGQKANICQKDYAPVIQEAWDITKAVILELQHEIKAHDAKLVVLMIPAAPQIVVPKEGGDWYCDQPNKELVTCLDSESIPYLDMLEDLDSMHSMVGIRYILILIYI